MKFKVGDYILDPAVPDCIFKVIDIDETLVAIFDRRLLIIKPSFKKDGTPIKCSVNLSVDEKFVTLVPPLLVLAIQTE